MRQDPIYATTLARMSADELQQKLSSGPEEAARWVYAAAVAGSTAAQIAWGQMLLDGHGVKADPAAALRWFTIAASAGNPDGINMVGRCYQLGWGVAADPREAARWFRKAADRGHAFAQFNLATLMLEGRGLPQDPAGALSLLVRAARRGNAKAMNMIGRFRECGWTGPVRLASAMRWYRRAADGGCFRGSFHLGRFLAERGDVVAAAERFRVSVDGAPADFCRDAAALLLSRPEPALRSVGRHALARAAEADGEADLFAYGRALADGVGGPVDLAQARVWLARAQARGYPGAAAALEEVTARMRATRRTPAAWVRLRGA